MTRNQRKRYFVDRHVQGALIRRAVIYALLVMLLMALLSTLGLAVLDGPPSGRQFAEQMWSRFGLACVATILLIPVIAIDCIRLSNRFAGPMFPNATRDEGCWSGQGCFAGQDSQGRFLA